MLFRVILMANLVLPLSSLARPPEGKAEGTLLYWRYLCAGGAQDEKIVDHRREFKCLSQSWSVIGPEDRGIVEEIHSVAK